MHQSKKEIPTKLWNKKVAFDMNDDLDTEELIENTLISTEIGNVPISNNIRRIR